MLPETNVRSSSSKGEKLAQRLSHILALLHRGDLLDKHQLAEDFAVDIRTIERDLGNRLQGFAERNAEGRWQLTHTSRGAIPARYLNGYARLIGTEHLFPDSSLGYLLAQLEIPAHCNPTHVQPTSYEDLGAQKPTFTQLETAIEHHSECRFTYKGKPRHAQPYRLIHKNGVWYLAADEAGRLKNFSVALIECLQIDEASRFTPKPAHHAYIDNKDDVWFTENTIEVLLRVAPDVAHFFMRRKLLPEQRHRLDKDGSLLVTTQVNHMNQLFPVVRWWLPHVRIVEPLKWHAELVSGLQQVLKTWAD